jgi:hypothetical protein
VTAAPSEASASAALSEEAPSALAWRVWPWTLFLPAAPLFAAAFAALFVYAAFVVRDGVWAGLVAVSAWVVLGELVLPVAYAIGDEGIDVHGTLAGARRFPWRGFESYRIASAGRVAALRLRGGGPSRWWRRDLTIYVPRDPALRERLERRLRAQLAPGA